MYDVEKGIENALRLKLFKNVCTVHTHEKREREGTSKRCGQHSKSNSKLRQKYDRTIFERETMRKANGHGEHKRCKLE